MFDEDNNAMLKNLSEMGERLKQLKLDMDVAEAQYSDAKKAYEHYANQILPMEMFTAGVAEVKLMSGGTMSYVRKFYCQPNKNDTDKQVMSMWLRENGGEHLIKEKASVDASQMDALRASGIPYVEISDFNTNSLKAFLTDKIGAKGGIAQIQVQDIPACMHFQEVGIVTIDV